MRLQLEQKFLITVNSDWSKALQIHLLGRQMEQQKTRGHVLIPIELGEGREAGQLAIT